MLDLALAGSTALLGLAGAPHCAAMCGAACTAVCGGDDRAGGWGFHLARVIGYAAVGGVAAGSVGALAWFGQGTASIRPLWTLLHVAALGLGLWMLWRGEMPRWLAERGRGRSPGGQLAMAGTPVQFTPRAAVPVPAWRAGTAGLLWAAWPCGLLQSALLVAALADTAWGGALAMSSFAAASAGGLVLAPWAWRRWAAGPQGARRALRVAGALVVAASAWALGHGLWDRVVAWCLPAAG